MTPAADTLHLALVAGEASGDLIASHMVGALRQHWSQVQVSGIGGPRLQAQGMDCWWPSDRLAVRGFAEVLPRLPELLRMRKQLGDRLLVNKPDVFVGVDAPDFNLDLECRLRAAGVPTVHFVCPSFWAWRPEKVLKLKAAAGHVLCLFPFEPELLKQHGIDATFVGHPLAQMIPLQPNAAAARAELGLLPDAPVVAILPGSRQDEVKYLADRFFAAAVLMQRQQPNLQFVVPAMPALKSAIESAAHKAGLHHNITILQGQSHRVLEACDVTLIASGTATLEAALYKKPMVIAYNMHAVSWWLMRRKRLQPWVGLPNILLNDSVVPEWLQDEATPERLAQSTLAWLQPSEAKDRLHARFSALHQQLRQDTMGLVTHAIEKVVRG